MNTGTLEASYEDWILKITPEWLTISDNDDEVKYICETKDAYPDNMVPESLDSWYHLLSFEDEDKHVIDDFCCLIAVYTDGWIEEYLEGFGVLLKCLKHIDVKYTK